MAERTAPKLVREDPDREPLVGNIKVTREDWLNLARDVLVHDGVAELKILSLAERLDVSRSSFYWYFKSKSDLQESLLDEWENRNTGQILAQCRLPSRTIAEAVSNFFRCFVDSDGFDSGLDFAMREWSRRNANVRARIDKADATRLEAVTQLFLRHGYPEEEADIRARVIYFQQIGYHALELRESLETRLSRVAGFLRAFTGQEPDDQTMDEFLTYARLKGPKS
ncbi:TetR/AcrR family transcriptional regulator [Pacificoceanicola onchidii]|uniref:TetR/AcrR family transcriptional regulator n=1 Tax=Pacificoceanicola onchidii TaxID=2562685 RepID=UPI0010A67307|nr:TetR/AcrR family transcriptional regulator [Pacificoceanicola onchidii]